MNNKNSCPFLFLLSCLFVKSHINKIHDRMNLSMVRTHGITSHIAFCFNIELLTNIENNIDHRMEKG